MASEQRGIDADAFVEALKRLESELYRIARVGSAGERDLLVNALLRATGIYEVLGTAWYGQQHVITHDEMEAVREKLVATFVGVPAPLSTAVRHLVKLEATNG